MGTHTRGNWTIELQVTDSVSTPKNLSIPDLSYASDYTAGGRGSLNGDNTVVLQNISGDDLIPQEVYEYALSRAANVYAGTTIPSAQQAPVKSGRKLAVKATMSYHATNSVSGEEIFLPFEFWTVVKVPDMNLVSVDIVDEALRRHLAQFFGTGSTDGSLLARMLRGDLDPTA
jgi:hypothetical protein